ncbi:hypothetical protein ABT272_43540 [Streptomyces sp900105245]|uniref:Transposase n=1 Tax=Streptomyces sp. 900105245 TaxID=3154379 RepID=A0ABV1UL35_9ACTN
MNTRAWIVFLDESGLSLLPHLCEDWLTLERLRAYAPELNPVELLWSSLKKRELANLAGDDLADVADATEQGIHRITRGRTPLLRHRLNWKRASMAGALGHHSTDPDRGPRLCSLLKPGSYDIAGLIEALEQI